MKCEAKHTQYQPSDTEWRCPKCNAEAGVWALDESSVGADEECELLHGNDSLRCYDCGYETNGRAFATRVRKATSRVQCNHCKGTGWVDTSTDDDRVRHALLAAHSDAEELDDSSTVRAVIEDLANTLGISLATTRQ